VLLLDQQVAQVADYPTYMLPLPGIVLNYLFYLGFIVHPHSLHVLLEGSCQRTIHKPPFLLVFRVFEAAGGWD
jgi:hypothetical protein